MRNIGFFKNGTILSHNEPLEKLLQADAAALKITNEKNSRMGEVFHHEAILDKPCCPIKVLAQQVHYILQNEDTGETLLCMYYKNGQEKIAISREMVLVVRSTTKK